MWIFYSEKSGTPPKWILAKSEPAFQISPAKCAGKFRYPKEGFCYYMKEGTEETDVRVCLFYLCLVSVGTGGSFGLQGVSIGI